MPELSSWVRAGAIVPFGASLPEDDRCGEVVAGHYQHRALQGRTVVRLSVAEVAQGVDAEMAALGFTLSASARQLGHQKFRALGFPGWAMVHDPKRSRFALEVTRDFKKAKKRVRSKPGHARDAFVAIAERLGRSVPHFLPSFWEEAGRAFIEEESATYAAQCFEKARLVEKEHKLAVDEDARSAVYLEFALAGAVAAKSLSGYAKELEKRYGAQEAFERYRELALRRTLGGLPPWTGMGKELRALGKAAGVDVSAEESRFVTEVLDAPAIARAPRDFWQLYRHALVSVAQRDVGVRARLTQLFPQPSAGGEQFSDFWLELLEESGVIAWLLETPVAPRDASSAGKWLSAAFIYLAEGDSSLEALLTRFRERLVTDQVPVDLVNGVGWRGVELPLLEHALSLGIPLEPPGERASLSPRSFDCDPVRVSAHPELAELLAETVAGVMGEPSFEAASRGKPGFAAARERWLDAQLALLETGAFHSVAQALATLTKQSTAALFAEFPSAYERLSKLQLGSALARCLRGGLFAELTWPVWEEVVAELGAASCRLDGCYPHPVLHNAVKAVALGANARLAEHDFVLPKGGVPAAVWWLDGQFLVVVEAPGQPTRAYWSARPHDAFEFPRFLHRYDTDLETAWPSPDGGLITVHGTVHAGDKDVNIEYLVSDGQTFWKRAFHDGALKLTELEPKTGAEGRSSWPSFVTPLSERHDDFELRSVWLMPLPPGVVESPLGQRDGLGGYATRRARGGRWEVTGIDGRTRSASYEMGALVTWPGASEPRSLVAVRAWAMGGRGLTVELKDPRGEPLGTSGEGAWTAGHGVPVPLSCFHFLRPRDLAGSEALREISDATANALLGGDEATTRRLVEQHLGAIATGPLRDAVVQAALTGTQLAAAVAQLLVERAPERATDLPELTINDGDLVAAAGVLSDRRWCSHDWTADVLSVGRFLAGETVTSVQPSDLHWGRWLPKTRALAVLVVAPFTSEASRTTLLGALTTLQRAGFFEHPSQLRVAEICFGKDPPALDANKLWRTTAGSSRCYVRPEDTYDISESPGLMIERSTDGAFHLPPGLSLRKEWRLLERDDAGYLRRVLELASTVVPTPAATSAAELVAEITGMTRAESCLLWLGLSTLKVDPRSDPRVKQVLDACELKSTDAKVALGTFSEVPAETWLELLDRAAPDDPAELFEPELMARRVAEAWVKLKGKRLPLRDELVTAVEKELAPAVSSAALLEAALAPELSRLMRVREHAFDDLFAWRQPNDCFAGPAISAIAELIAWGFAALPVGDPYRDALVGLHAATLAHLKDPKLQLKVHSSYGDPQELRAVFDALGGEVRLTEEEDASSRLSESERYSASLVDMLPSQALLEIAFRPSKVADDDALLSSLEDTDGSAVAHVAFLRGPACASLIERLKHTPVPAGAFEHNPQHSAPEVLERARQKLGLSPEAALLYLQILALPEPTNKNVQLYNDWKPAQLKRAGAELLAKGLVVEGKRERAGRELFLPGPWEKGRGKSLPMERWKLELYRLPRGAFSRTLSPHPSHLLFETALARIERGDAPRLEEV